jgi:hypothetical protein
MPEHSQARGWYPPKSRELIRHYLSRVGEEFQAPVIDIRTWVPDEDFADYCHMRPEGVPAFCDRLGREIVKPFVEGSEICRDHLLHDDGDMTR